MKTTVIRSTWIPSYGYRLDTKPYVGGALEAKVLLESLPITKDLVRDLVLPQYGGIYFAGRESVNWVESAEFGIPFLRGRDIQLADLSYSSYISKQQANSNPTLLIRKGMTLITRSGTIGKTAYVRTEMDGMATSDPLRVVPDPKKIPSGYLYTYLSSSFGVPLLASGAYGAIIQHLEPSDIASIPVPRLGSALELEIHELIEKAAELRSNASVLKRKAVAEFLSGCAVEDVPAMHLYSSPHLGQACSAQLAGRMDSIYYIRASSDARTVFDLASESGESLPLGRVAEIFIPSIFKRQYASDPDCGFPYMTGADVFSIQPKSNLYLMRSVAKKHRLVLQSGMILIHEAGSRYGLIGRTAMVGATLHGCACTNNMVRVLPHDPLDMGYIFSVLSSEAGIRLLKREAAGSAIPHLDENRVASLIIPWPKREVRQRIASIAHEARDNWENADELENQAMGKLVNTIESYAGK